MKITSFKLAFLACFLFSSVIFADEPTTIILVRHAEKGTAPADNPSLTEAGKARATELVRVVGMSDIKAVYSSQYARTRETAEFVAQHFSIPVQQVDAAKTNDLVSDILSRHAGETVLVVGHSNTLPEIVQAFGGPAIADPEDNEYDNLLVLFVSSPGKAKLVPLKFGEKQK